MLDRLQSLRKVQRSMSAWEWSQKDFGIVFGEAGPVKPFKNVTFLLIVAPLEMLPGSAAGQAREPPRSEMA